MILPRLKSLINVSFLHKPATSAQITPSLSRSSSSRNSFSSDRLDSLDEVTYLPKDDTIHVTNFSIINPYNVFTKPSSSLARSVKSLVQN